MDSHSLGGSALGAGASSAGQGWGQHIFGSGYNQNTFSSGIGDLLSSIFGMNKDPYSNATKVFQPYFNQAASYQNPFYETGKNALGPYQNMLGQMSDPSKFMNTLMGNYQQSPWAKNLLATTQQAGNNAASASGLVGSTPFMQSSQQNAQNISSQDMQNWIGSVLGINNSALAGYGNLAGMGQNASNNLSNMWGNFGTNAANLDIQSRIGNNQNMSNMFGGAASIAAMFL